MADHEDGAPPRREALASIGRALDALSAPAYMAADSGTILAVSPALAEFVGMEAAEMVGQDGHDLLHRNEYGETVARARCGIREAGLTRRTAQGDRMWVGRADGSVAEVGWLATGCRMEGLGTLALVIFTPRPGPDGEEGAPAAAEEAEPHGAALSELERLALLAETTTRLTSTLDVEEALRRLTRLMVPRLADWAVIDLIERNAEVTRFAVAHQEDGTVVRRPDLEGPMPPIPPESPMPLSRALRGAASAIASPETYHGPPDAEIAVAQRRLFDATGMHSAVIAPIRGLRQVLGALTLGRSEQPEPFTPAHLALLEDITRRAGLALDNARLYERQRTVGQTMQRHLLPQLPRVPGLGLAARYRPAPEDSEVGGDWYDAFVLGDGALVLAVGDVVGHDLEAAAGMAQLRNMLRAYSWSEQSPPSKIVEWLDLACLNIAEVSMATLICGRLTCSADGHYQLSWTNAGHPPPLLVTPDGEARYLPDGHGPLLGLDVSPVRPDGVAVLPAGSTVVLYTDGLVESPRDSIDDGLDRLRRNAAALVHRDLDDFTDELLESSRPPHNEDDVAMLAVRIPAEPGARPPRWRPPAR
ncbi:SpoIIE family protein phosphatase [Streptomyces fragilis]|uniref:SpoIIE family protein phosphatase n=1 Tax=Streptomyces fragilis TaxID=67301 RepID=A0ABV2YQI1_9ACTN|nr:SpoIIE family protein phosphatase [Streptomyces fragilis]